MWSHCFKVLEVDEDDEEQVDGQQVCHIRNVAAKSGEKDNKKKCQTDDEWLNLGIGEIVVDSAADESCWPIGVGDALPTRPSKRNILLKTANGGEMGHNGEKCITFTHDGDGDKEVVGLKFQVTDVRKPLLAVRRLVERGSVVSFGAKDDELVSSPFPAAAPRSPRCEGQLRAAPMLWPVPVVVWPSQDPSVCCQSEPPLWRNYQRDFHPAVAKPQSVTTR